MGAITFYFTIEDRDLETFVNNLCKGEKSTFIVDAIRSHRHEHIITEIEKSKQNTIAWERRHKNLSEHTVHQEEKKEEQEETNEAWFEERSTTLIGGRPGQQKDEILKGVRYWASSQSKLFKEHGYTEQTFMTKFELYLSQRRDV